MGSGTVPQSRSQGPAPPAPRAGSPCGPCACGASAAPPPPPRRGHPRQLRSWCGGGWLVLGLWGLGGEEFSGVWVDFVEVGVVGVLGVGVVRRHLLDAGGDAHHRLHVRLRGRPAPRPPPFDPPSAPVSHAPSCLSLGARGALALALGPPSGPDASVPPPRRGSPPLSPTPRPALPAPVPVPCPCPCPWLRPRWPTVPRSAPCTWAPCPRPCAPFPCPGPFTAPCPVSLLPLPALYLAPPLLASVPCPCLRPCSLPRVRGPAPCACPWAHPPSPPVPRYALPWLARSSDWATSPPSWITRRASRCLCNCSSVTPGGEHSGNGGQTCRVRPGGKGLVGNGFGGAGVGVYGLAWARYFAPSLPTAAAAAAAGEAPVARAGSVPRFRGVLGAAARLAEAVARLAGAAVAKTRAPSPLPSATAAALRDAPGSYAGATPRVGGMSGAAVGAAAWLAGAAVSAPRVSGAPSRGGAAGLAVWAAGAVTSAVSGSWVDGPVSAEAAWGCPASSPTGTAASASPRSSLSAGVSPAPSGEKGERDAGPAVVAVTSLGGAIGV